MSEPDPRDSAHPMMDTKIANGNPALEAKLKDSELNKSPVHIKTSPLGIYTLFTEVTTLGGLLPGYDIWAGIEGFLQDWPYIKIFIIECVSLGPTLILRWAILSMISSLLPALSLYLSGNLLGLVQTGFENRNLDHTRFYVTVACLLASKTLESIIDFACHDTIREIKRLSTFHFGDHLIRAHLRLDFPTSLDPSNTTTLKRISPNHAGDQGFRIMEDMNQGVTCLVLLLL
ncbi:hypothetical protein BS47DRAFT_729412 [Hydnum rufescens UP504]|uniref:Uncharacterized protein n=1 Tax=Hydnum rufescens UP504 TaxID=1448309 RepID=A0A9P6DV04_9AGAM|nr:hypothetical protein BS47DRAFT_729412 [Hydnum rufescens UP504]